MIETNRVAVAFDDPDTRSDEMQRTIETWIEDLIDLVEDATASDAFQQWLDVQSRFHDYSPRNTLLITLQCPEATRVAGYRTWQTKFERHVNEGEKAIWIRAPIITKQCPDCGNSPSYHERSGCEYNETPPNEWSRGVVGFRPAAVFDVSQTEGEPLPGLETDAVGDAEDLVPALLDAAGGFDIDVAVVNVAEWSYGKAKGVCKQAHSQDATTVVKVKASENNADLAVTLVHEYAHALLHFGVETQDECSKREVEAEAVAYLVGRYYGFDMSGSAFYLAAWMDEEPESILERLDRIRRTATEIIDTTDDHRDLLQRGSLFVVPL